MGAAYNYLWGTKIRLVTCLLWKKDECYSEQSFFKCLKTCLVEVVQSASSHSEVRHYHVWWDNHSGANEYKVGFWEAAGNYFRTEQRSPSLCGLAFSHSVIWLFLASVGFLPNPCLPCDLNDEDEMADMAVRMCLWSQCVFMSQPSLQLILQLIFLGFTP